MRSREASLVNELRCGTGVALTLGGMLGAGVAAWFLVSEHAHLVLPGGLERVAAVVLSTSVGGLLAVVCMLPFELLMALLRGTTTIRFSSRRFYAAVLVVGVVFVHAFLWTFTNAIRDIGTPTGLGASAAMVVVAMAFFVVALRVRAGERHRVATDGRWLPVVSSLAVMAALAYLSHGALASSLRVDAGASEVSGAPSVVAAAAVDEPPNVVLISIDTLRADHVGAYGYARATTPRIDRLAREGALFANAFSQAPWTLPSHATMLTGQYSTRHGARFYSSIRLFAYVADALRPFNVTLGETLGAAGYQTAGVTSMDWLSAEFGFDQGFDHLVSLPRGNRTANLVVDEALSWVEARDRRRPFFLFMHLFDVHEFEAPEEINRRYVDAGYRGLFEKADLRGGNLHDHVTDADLEYMMGRYDAALAYVDSELGRFFDALADAGVGDDTLVILTSDHGEEFWDHGGLGHGLTLYREQLHVPLVIKPPGGRPRVSRPVDAFSGLIDLAPTVIDYVGLSPVANHQGVSLRPVIEGRGEIPSRLLFAEDTFFFNTYAVLSEELKFICNRIPPPDLLSFELLPANLRGFYRYRGDELYETDVDPNEQANIVSSRRELSDELDDVLVEHLEAAQFFGTQTLDEDLVDRLRSLGYVQ